MIAYSQNFGRVTNCESGAIKNLISQHEYCGNIQSRDVRVNLKCEIEVWESYNRSSCTNSGKASASNQIFIHNRMIEVMTDLFAGKLPREQGLSQFSRLSEISIEALDTQKRNMASEFNDIAENQIERQNYNFISQTFRMLGANQQTSTRQNQATYIFNGRIINCNTFGNTVTCN